MSAAGHTLACRTDVRRGAVRAHEQLTGLDFVEVDTSQTALRVYFLGRLPAGLSKEAIHISGGRTERDAVTVLDVDLYPSDDPRHDDVAVIHVDRPGDYSTYRLTLVGLDDVDPRYTALDFSFKANCPSHLDCRADCPPVVAADATPGVDYLAKDYAGFRQLILDRIALLASEWTERHVPDIGITLVELLAYVGDYLSYYQDAVATEAYIGTARRRVSMRRHARLVGYQLGEGCNARALVTIEVGQDLEFDLAYLSFITNLPQLPETAGSPARLLESIPSTAYEQFEPVETGMVRLWRDHGEIRLHDWGQQECCLSAGATRATLRGFLGKPGQCSEDTPQPEQKRRGKGADKKPNKDEAKDEAAPVEAAACPAFPTLWLRPGDLLIFEEVLSPSTGRPEDVDLTHRQAVRLVEVTEGHDQLLGVPVVEIAWHPDDALAFDLCLSALGPAPDCALLDPVSVARGNVVPVDHGRCLPPEPLPPPPEIVVPGCCDCIGHAIESQSRSRRYRPELARVPLTFAARVDSAASARAYLAPEAATAVPAVQLNSADGTGWHPLPDLLACGPTDRAFVVEMEEDGIAHLRFGDGLSGAEPPAGIAFTAHYRVGNGPAGNVGAEAIARLIHRESDLSNDVVKVRNPLAAQGGTARETMENALLMAPFAFQVGPAALKRAIVAGDYALIARRDLRVQSSAARLVWSGSWYVADTGLDPRALPPGDLADIVADCAERLETVRRIGHDLRVRPAVPVPIDLALHVCVAPGYVAAHVKADVLEALSSSAPRGFFHPDALVCGASVRLSAIVSAVHAVSGVSSVFVRRFQRQFELPAGEIAAGLLPIAPWEVARLANDLNHPEQGVLVVDVEGGR